VSQWRWDAPPSSALSSGYWPRSRASTKRLTPIEHDLMNSKSGVSWVLVLPDPKADPASFRQTRIGVFVAFPGRGHLRCPELSVPHRDCVVLRAPVPEATIEEDRDAGPRKYQVSSSSELLEWSHGDSVTKAKCVHCRTQGHLRFCVPALVGLHARADAGRRGPRVWHRSSLRAASQAVPVGGGE
jgi:hypothetical protein